MKGKPNKTNEVQVKDEVVDEVVDEDEVEIADAAYEEETCSVRVRKTTDSNQVPLEIELLVKVRKYGKQ